MQDAKPRVIRALVNPHKMHVGYPSSMATAVDLKAIFTRDVEGEALFRVRTEVIEAINIEFEVLVFDTDTGVFRRVASVYDMETYPIGRELAAYNNLAYYRARTGAVEYASLREATYYEKVTKQRLQILANAWSTVVDKFSGEAVYNARSYQR